MVVKILYAAQAILFFLALSTGVKASDQKDTVKILFLGSSSTYCHDLPLQVSDWLNDHAGWKSIAFLTGKSGTGFQDYLRPGFQAQYGLRDGQTLLAKIAEERYDYVVIQQITYFMGDKDSAQIVAATKQVCDAVRRSGGIPVFYEMGWRLGPENETGRVRILEEAIKNNVDYYAPCSRAWVRVRKERPDIELHNLPDTDHPGTLGNYLNMCCLYAALTGKSPVGLPGNIKSWPRFGSFDKVLAKEKLKTSEPDYYHRVMPEWMQMISVMGEEVSVDSEVARYLQQVAWRVWQDTSKSLSGKER